MLFSFKLGIKLCTYLAKTQNFDVLQNDLPFLSVSLTNSSILVRSIWYSISVSQRNIAIIYMANSRGHDLLMTELCALSKHLHVINGSKNEKFAWSLLFCLEDFCTQRRLVLWLLSYQDTYKWELPSFPIHWSIQILSLHKKIKSEVKMPVVLIENKKTLSLYSNGQMANSNGQMTQ